MHLYLIAGRINIEVLDVTLVDGYRPSVGGYRPDVEALEPAIWFKVMVIDTVTIDCDERRLSWVPLCDSSVSNFVALESEVALCGSYRLSGSSAGDDQRDLIDYSDDTLYCQLNEAFEVIPDILARYESNQVMRDDFNEQLMQLLHVHILPSIRLTAQDRECIVDCIDSLKVVIDQIDKDISRIAENTSNVEKSLANLRKKVLYQLMSGDKKANSGNMISHDFIRQLLEKEGIEKDIAIAWAAVEDAQVTVERLKENPEANSAELSSQRAKRDLVTAEYEQLLIAREKLKEMTRSGRGLAKRVRDAFHEDQQHKIYGVIMSKLKEFEKLNEVITHKKLLVTSVKEAARLALNDIQSGNDSFGMEVDSVGAAHSTDVLGGSVTGPWQSLAKQIASILGNTSHQIAKLHRDFCRHIADVCSATVLEKQLYDESVQALQRSSNCSSKWKAETCNSIVHSSSSSSMSEFYVDLGNSAFSQSDCASLSGEQSCHLSNSMELTKPDPLVRSLPVFQTHPVENKVSRKPEIRKNSWSLRKAKSSSLTPSFQSYVPRGLISISPKDSSQDSPVIIVDTDRDCVRSAVELIRKKILDHFNRISIQLQHELSVSSGKSHYQQIWLDYESHFYQEMMVALTELYQLQYATITDAFCSSLPELTPSDLSLDEAVLIHLLQGQHEESTCSFEICTQADSYDTENSHRSHTLTRCTGLAGAQMSDEGHVDDSTESDDLSRLLRSHSEENKRPPLRTVRISMPVIVVPHSPTSVLVYERTLAPLPSSLQSNTRLTLTATSMTLKPCYRQQFEPALKQIEAAIEARTPESKLRHLTDCLRETTKQLAAFYVELYGDSSSQSSCDELLDAVVILLCNVTGHQMALLYCQLSLLADLMAPWLVRGPYSFTLVQFTAACQFIQERLMMKRNRHISNQ